MASSVKVRIDSNAIANWTLNPLGMVSRFTRQVARETSIEAGIITAIKANKANLRVGSPGFQTGRLKDSYGVSWRRSTARSVVWIVSNSRPYAGYVFLGHGPALASSKNNPLLVGKSQLAGRGHLSDQQWELIRKRMSVRGYGGANYPMMALRAVYRRRGL